MIVRDYSRLPRSVSPWRQSRHRHLLSNGNDTCPRYPQDPPLAPAPAGSDGMVEVASEAEKDRYRDRRGQAGRPYR